MMTFLAAIPNIIGIVVVLVIGWFIAKLIKKGIAALLRTEKFNDLTNHSGFNDFISKIGVKADSAGLIALIIMVGALNALGLPAVSDILQQQVLWLPNLVVALVIIVIGGLAAEALSSLVRGAASRPELSNPDLWATIINLVVWTFAIVIAINQMGFAITFIELLFIATIGTMVLALNLALGLSGRKTAAEILRGWYGTVTQVIPKMKEVAQVAKKQAQQQTRPMHSRR